VSSLKNNFWKRTTGLLWLALALGSSGIASAADANAAKSELERFAGPWSFALVKVSGQRQFNLEADHRLIFQKDGRFTVVQGPQITHGTITVDPGQTPKHYDIHMGTGSSKGKTVPAIYEIEGDTLTICMPLSGNERPTALKSKAGDGHLFQVFQREHDDVPAALIAAGRRELTGRWLAASYVLDGKKASDDDVKKIELVFDAEGNTKALNDRKLFIASSTKIAPTANPSAIDITFTEGEGKGGTALGIYKVEDGVLTICRSAPGKARPTEFSSNPGSGLTLMSYKKLHGPRHFRPRRGTGG
jgi:uncharacterized protein (TIGR03067 family)